MKSCLEKNDIETNSTHNEGKSVIAERFIRTLKNKIYKYMTSISKNVYIDKLDIEDKYSNTYYRTIKFKPVDVKLNTYINSSKKTNNQDPKFKIGDIVRISKYIKTVFAKGYVPNRSKEILAFTKVKKNAPCKYVISDHKGEKIVGAF